MFKHLWRPAMKNVPLASLPSPTPSMATPWQQSHNPVAQLRPTQALKGRPICFQVPRATPASAPASQLPARAPRLQLFRLASQASLPPHGPQGLLLPQQRARASAVHRLSCPAAWLFPKRRAQALHGSPLTKSPSTGSPTTLGPTTVSPSTGGVPTTISPSTGVPTTVAGCREIAFSQHDLGKQHTRQKHSCLF